MPETPLLYTQVIITLKCLGFFFPDLHYIAYIVLYYITLQWPHKGCRPPIGQEAAGSNQSEASRRLHCFTQLHCTALHCFTLGNLTALFCFTVLQSLLWCIELLYSVAQHYYFELHWRTIRGKTWFNIDCNIASNITSIIADYSTKVWHDCQQYCWQCCSQYCWQPYWQHCRITIVSAILLMYQQYYLRYCFFN